MSLTKPTVTLCALLAAGCIQTIPAEEPKVPVVHLPPTPKVYVVRTEKVHVYHVVLPNMKIVKGNYVETKNDNVYFCSDDPDVEEKSYLEGEIDSFLITRDFDLSHIKIITKYDPGYSLYLKRYKWGAFSYEGEIVTLDYGDKIAVPTVFPLNMSCPEEGKMYMILNQNNVLEAKQIKVIEKKK